MHFAQVGKNRMLSREAHCRVIELCKKYYSSTSINKRYVITRDERNIRLKRVPEEWLLPWEKIGMDFEKFSDPELNYFDIEILQFFKQFGTPHFANLDIWDINWEFKRQLALDYEVEGIPEAIILDPRNWEQRMYHSYLHRHIKNPLWREPQRPFVQGLKKLGLKRSHFEELGLLPKN